MKEKQIKLQRGEREGEREEIRQGKEEIVRGSDIHYEGLKGKSVGKRERLKGKDREGSGGRRGS